MNKTRDTLERLVWSVIAATLTNLGSVGFLGIAAWKGAAMAGINGAITFLLVIARQHVAVLPAPGEGLPGLPTSDKGHSDLSLVLLAVVFFILGALCQKVGWLG